MHVFNYCYYLFYWYYFVSNSNVPSSHRLLAAWKREADQVTSNVSKRLNIQQLRTPLVWSSSDGMVRTTEVFLKQLASMLGERGDKPLHLVMSCIQCWFECAVVRLAVSVPEGCEVLSRPPCNWLTTPDWGQHLLHQSLSKSHTVDISIFFSVPHVLPE